MPCNSDYLAATGREIERRDAAFGLVLLQLMHCEPIDKNAAVAAGDYYGRCGPDLNYDPVVAFCKAVRRMAGKREPMELVDAMINKTHQSLSGVRAMWARHEREDRKREEAERDKMARGFWFGSDAG